MLKGVMSIGQNLGGSRGENDFGINMKRYDEKPKIHRSS
jgi:hypothetical protein